MPRDKKKHSEYCKKWRAEHKNEVLEYKEKNNKKFREYRKKWKDNNKDKINEYNNRPEVKTVVRLRGRIRSAMKGISKSQSTIKLLGCDIITFLKYIESKFAEGMTWENYGLYGWHIDHIIPCSSFDLTKPEEQSICFHYTNLQPLGKR